MVCKTEKKRTCFINFFLFGLFSPNKIQTTQTLTHDSNLLLSSSNLEKGRMAEQWTISLHNSHFANNSLPSFIDFDGDELYSWCLYQRPIEVFLLKQIDERFFFWKGKFIHFFPGFYDNWRLLGEFSGFLKIFLSGSSFKFPFFGRRMSKMKNLSIPQDK